MINDINRSFSCFHVTSDWIQVLSGNILSLVCANVTHSLNALCTTVCFVSSNKPVFHFPWKMPLTTSRICHVDACSYNIFYDEINKLEFYTFIVFLPFNFKPKYTTENKVHKNERKRYQLSAVGILTADIHFLTTRSKKPTVKCY